MDKIDRGALRRDLRTIEAEIRPIKRALGSPWTRPMADDQRRLQFLRGRATELCAALAASRGRVHLRPRGWTEAQVAEWHREVGERLAARYAERLESALGSVTS